MKKLPWYIRDLISLTILVAVLVGLAYLLDAIPIGGMAYYNRIIVMMGINITLAVSLNIINGHAGQFSLGHAGFMAVGAYFAAFLTVYYFSPVVDKMPPGTQQWIAQNAFVLAAVLLGGTLAAIAGYLVGLPSLRLRGDYLAIVTLGFGEIVRVLLQRSGDVLYDREDIKAAPIFGIVQLFNWEQIKLFVSSGFDSSQTSWEMPLAARLGSAL